MDDRELFIPYCDEGYGVIITPPGVVVSEKGGKMSYILLAAFVLLLVFIKWVLGKS